MHTCTMHAVIESEHDNHDNSHSLNTHNSPENCRSFYFSSVYVAQVAIAAAHKKRLRRPRTAVKGIHDFVQLQGNDERVRSANATWQGFRRNFSRPGSTDERRTARDDPPDSRAIEKNDSDSKVGGCCCPPLVPV